MPMTPKERKIELLRADATMAEIARQLGLTIGHVSQVIAGKRRSPSVEQAVAAAIGKPVERVFGSRASDHAMWSGR